MFFYDNYVIVRVIDIKGKNSHYICVGLFKNSLNVSDKNMSVFIDVRVEGNGRPGECHYRSLPQRNRRPALDFPRGRGQFAYKWNFGNWLLGKI